MTDTESKATATGLALVFLTVLGAVGFASCGTGGPGPAVVVRDSAGIEIVENRAPAWEPGSGRAWRLAGAPALEIGVLEGASEYQFAAVVGAVRLSDGRIVVAEGGTQEIRFFDVRGRYVGRSGGRGDAPGEYRQLSDLGVGAADSVWAYDFAARRFTILGPDGGVMRTVRLGGELSNVGAVGRTNDGAFVVREHWSSRAHARQLEPGLVRSPAVLARYSADGGDLDTIGQFPGREVVIGSEGGRAVMSAPLFGRAMSAAVRGDDVFVGDQESFEIGLYSAAGALRRLIRFPDVDLALSADDIERALEERVSQEPVTRREMLRAHLEALDVPATRPAYGRFLVDAEGNLWVAEASHRGTSGRWRVFAVDGRLLGAVAVPERFRLSQIGTDWALGIWRDELDVERIRLYRVQKPGPPAQP